MLGGGKRSLVCKLMMMMLLLTHLAFSSENAFSQQSITVRFEQQTLSEVLNVLKLEKFIHNTLLQRNYFSLFETHHFVCGEKALYL